MEMCGCVSQAPGVFLCTNGDLCVEGPVVENLPNDVWVFCVPMEMCVLQGPVVENLSKRCGGFLKALSLRGCQVITDQALRWVRRPA